MLVSYKTKTLKPSVHEILMALILKIKIKNKFLLNF